MCYTRACGYAYHTTGYDCGCSKPEGEPCPWELGEIKIIESHDGEVEDILDEYFKDK